MRNSMALNFLTGVSNTFRFVCQFYSCGRNGKMALGPSLGDQSQSMIQLLFDSPVITCKQNQVSFIFREWGYLRCSPANTKCPSVTYKQGKQRIKTTRNRVSVIYTCWSIIEAFPSLQSPRLLRAKNREVFSCEGLSSAEVLIPFYLQLPCTDLPQIEFKCLNYSTPLGICTPRTYECPGSCLEIICLEHHPSRRNVPQPPNSCYNDTGLVSLPQSAETIVN